MYAIPRAPLPIRLSRAGGAPGFDGGLRARRTVGDSLPPPRPARRYRARATGRPRVTTVATGLQFAWELVLVPDGRAVVTERPGRVRLLSKDLKLDPDPLAEIEVNADGKGGLLGAAADPDFDRNRFVYL